MDFPDTFCLPERLAWDLTRTKSEGVLFTKAITGETPRPSFDPTDQTQTMRRKLRPSTSASHRALPKVGPHDMSQLDRHCGDIYAESRHSQQSHVLEVRGHHMEQERGEKRLYLNGLDGDCCFSDSSVEADADADAQPPSIRTRQHSFNTVTTSVGAPSVAGAEQQPSPSKTRRHSITTAATSVEAQSPIGGAPLSDDQEKQADSMHMVPDSSWVDLDPDKVYSEGRVNEDVNYTATLQESHRPHSSLALYDRDPDRSSYSTIIDIPERRSSLSYRVTSTTVASDASVSPHNSALISAPLTREFAAQLLLPSPQDSHHQHSNLMVNGYDDSEAAIGPIIPTGSRPPLDSNCQFSEYQDEALSLPPLPTLKIRVFDSFAAQKHDNHSQPALLNKLRKARSLSKMPSLVSVQSWLESSSTDSPSLPSPLRHKTPSSMSTSSGLRISHDILDTLRVSIACFPETMLLTSSLTIETIRTYSRSLKRAHTLARNSDDISPGSSASSPPFILPSPEQTTPKRWRIAKAFGARRGPSSPKELWPVQEDTSLPLTSTSSSASDASWSAIRNIFPEGSEYLCNALYAHIVAYNYVVSICRKNAQCHSDSPDRRFFTPRPSMASSMREHIDDELEVDVDLSRPPDYRDGCRDVGSNTVAGGAIPKKAANLLGLPHNPFVDNFNDSASANLKRKTVSGRGHAQKMARGIFSSPSASTPEKSEASNTVDSDAALGDLRDGLTNCIKRLVATLKLTSAAKTTTEGEAEAEDDEGPIKDVNVKELDPLLMRCLCEVVRACEEGH